MSSISTPRRVPFVRGSADLSLGYSLEGENLSFDRSSIEIKRAVRVFITQRSTLATLKGCGTVFLKAHHVWNRCEHPLCWSCARKRANDLSADLRERSASYPVIYSLQLSPQSTPSRSLSDAWDDLDTLRARLTAGRWLTSRVAAFRWFTEISYGPSGWNPHINLIVVSRNEIAPSEISHRWEQLAKAASIHATADAQHVARITRTTGKALRYAAKGPLSIHGDSHTLGSVLLSAALHGDATAATQWEEVELACLGRRWQGTGGEWRRNTAKATASSHPFSETIFSA